MGAGGVGKTTTAAALAVASADAGRSTHLLSIDPAHSIGDAFGAPVGAVPAPSPCGGRLRLEEFDAAAAARAWRAENAPAVRELLDRGTYLATEDAGRLSEMAPPALEEAMALLRLAALDADGAQRIVVDTPPAGHTLRLFDATRAIAAWVAVLEAAGAKGDAVATGLTGSGRRSAAGEVATRLARDLATARRVLGDAAFVLVTREEPVVGEATERLRAALAARGCAPPVVVAVGGGGADGGTIRLPRVAPPVGCDALRRLLRDAAAPEAGERRAAAGPPGAADDAVGALLASRRMVFFAGKGGVGRSTCAAAAAMALARRGGVTLAAMGAAPSLTAPGVRVVDLAAGEGEEDATALRERLSEAADRAITGTLGESALLDRRVAAALLEAGAPAVEEIMAAGRLASLKGRVVVDGAATAEFARLLDMPDVGLEWLRLLVRLAARYGGAAATIERDLLPAARRLRALREELRGDGAGVVVVTLDEDLVRSESERLAASLASRGIAVLAVLVNRVRDTASIGAEAWAGSPPVVAAPEMSPLPGGARGLDEFFQRWRMVR